MSKNSRRAKLGIKRQQNEEKRIEKQRRDGRVKTRQDLERKLGEIKGRVVDLDAEVVDLELLIGGDRVDFYCVYHVNSMGEKNVVNLSPVRNR